jgi:serine/threonine-protein kinase
VHGLLGRTKEGIAEVRKEVSPGYRTWGLAIACHLAGDSKASDEALTALLGEGEAWSFQIAAAYAMRGEPDPAFEWLERAYRLRDHGVVMVKVSRWLEGLRGDPRWPRFLKRMGFEDEETRA